MAKTGDVLAHLAELNKLRKEAVRFLLKERRALDRRLVKLGHAVGMGGKARKKGVRICGVCGKTGHNARSHKKA